MLRDSLESYIPTSSTSLFRQHNLNYVFVPWNFQIFNAAINIIDNLSTPIAYLLTRILLACWSFLSAKKSLFQKKNWKLFLFFLPSSICNRTSFIISRIAIIGNDFPMLGRIWYWLVDSSFTFFCDDVFSFDWMVDCVWDMISICIKKNWIFIENKFPEFPTTVICWFNCYGHQNSCNKQKHFKKLSQIVSNVTFYDALTLMQTNVHRTHRYRKLCLSIVHVHMLVGVHSFVIRFDYNAQSTQTTNHQPRNFIDSFSTIWFCLVIQNGWK